MGVRLSICVFVFVFVCMCACVCVCLAVPASVPQPPTGHSTHTGSVPAHTSKARLRGSELGSRSAMGSYHGQHVHEGAYGLA